MKQWSKYFQNIRFMDASRMMIMDADMSGVIAKWLGLKNGMRVLDVGCGIGAFTYYLSRMVEDCSFTGADIDEGFIHEAKNRIPNDKNHYDFITADGLNLPFADQSFDLVVSHTYLTSVPDPAAALAEKKRLAVYGGVVASVTAQQFDHIPSCLGQCLPQDVEDENSFRQLQIQVWRMYEAINPITNYICGVHPSQVPLLFARAGLLKVSAHGIGKSFSLSDASMPDEEKRKYIADYYDAEIEKFDLYMQDEKAAEYFSEDDAGKYRCAVRKRQKRLLETVGENRNWEWTGGSNLLMTGVKPLKMGWLK